MLDGNNGSLEFGTRGLLLALLLTNQLGDTENGLVKTSSGLDLATARTLTIGDRSWRGVKSFNSSQASEALPAFGRRRLGRLVHGVMGALSICIIDAANQLLVSSSS